MSDNVRLQNLRDFTVQIRDPASDAIVGTGIVVSMDGWIVTCAHVVRAANVEPRDGDDAEVGVYFPQARGGDVKARRATVACCFPQHDDDVLLLQLSGGPAPLGPEQIAVLGTADESVEHHFRSYGYRRLETYSAGIANGTILGEVEPPEGRTVQADPVQLESSQINAGMSGAAVLDVERNLVVGILSETWFPDLSTKDRDTAWPVNGRVLTFDPLKLPVRDAPLPKGAAPQPKTDIAEARAAVAPNLEPSFNGAPPPLDEWVGRADLLREIGADWADPTKRATGLIGFGGEGKSSLARRWLDDLLADLSLPRPDGVFWWGFYDKPGVDEFFEAALKYMGGGRIDPRALPSSNVRAQVIGAMLGAGCYLFVLDGLEVLQHNEGDQYGLLASADLREFLGYFAAPGVASFCLITSRIPLFDLQSYTTYTHRDVDRLSAADGRALLRRLDVKGTDAALDKLVADWDGHALTLSLLAAYLAERHGGDAARIRDIPAPTADEPRYERVHRVLRRYDEHLTEAERAFLTLFSAFRTPVAETAFATVFRARIEPSEPEKKLGRKPKRVAAIGPMNALNAPIAALDDAAFAALLKRLVDYRILRRDRRAGYYTTHPLIRAHYFARLTAGDRAETQAVHERIKDHYLAIAGDTPRFPALEDLMPLIEVVHHLCHASAYNAANRIWWDRIDQHGQFVLHRQLGACETELALLTEFFPSSDTSQDPKVSDSFIKSSILHRVGLCLMLLGRLSEAIEFYERAIAGYFTSESWRKASRAYLHLAELLFSRGVFVASSDAAQEALVLARRVRSKTSEIDALACRAWAAHLRGDLEGARAAFRQHDTLSQEAPSKRPYLIKQYGIWQVDYLRRVSDSNYAWRVAKANLDVCERKHWTEYISRCHYTLGDLAADDGQHNSAHMHYDEALKIARSMFHRGQVDADEVLAAIESPDDPRVQ